MKIYLRLLSLMLILTLFSSCEDLQKNVENKARKIQETTEKEIDERMNRVDSTLQGLDTTLQNKIDHQLEKVDTVINQLQENLK
jgi:predicted Holliday junction resolvase-like endonuclease